MLHMNYSELHDQQINMMVCKALGLEMSSYARIMTLDDATILLADNETLVDYCNNPTDAWPIIVENRISIRNRYGNDWMAENEWGKSHHHFDQNPLRAAMIVFLMMQDTK